jgi:hypothetical protein
MKCEFSNNCTFYEDHIAKMPVTANVYKRMYCDLDFVKCARNMTAAELGHELVPHDLFPTQNVRARKIIAEKTRTTAGVPAGKPCHDEKFLHTGTNGAPPGEEQPLSHETIAMQLLKHFNGDYVVALGEFYAEVRRKYPGYVCSIEPKADDAYYHAHQEYISIRDQIHSLVKKETG